MRKNAGQPHGLGVGAPSIMMIFLVLCLAALSVLAYATARVNERQVEKRIAHLEAWYAAANLAQREIARVDALAAADEYGEPVALTFDVAVSDTQVLHLALAVDPDAGERVTVREHRLNNIGEWETDDYYDDLMTGAE